MTFDVRSPETATEAAKYAKKLERMTLGEFVREIREAHGIKLRTLATASGLSAPFLSDLELGRRSCRMETLGKLATGLTKSGVKTTVDALAMKLRDDRIRTLEAELKDLKRGRK